MKRYIIIVVFFVITAVSFCQEETVYYANRDDILYREYQPMFGNDIGRINRGESLFILEGGVTYDTKDVYRTKVQTQDGRIGWLAVDSISVIDSEVLPDEITKNSWVHSYYLDILQSRKRETLFIYEPFWRDNFYKYKEINAMHPGDEETWYDVATWVTRFDFKTIYSKIRDLSNVNYYDLINGEISKIGTRFSFSVVCTYKRITFEETNMEKYFPLNEKHFMTLSLDGDYLDVFINGKKTFTLVKLNEETRNQFKNLMENNACDLSRIVWPHRADGSTDYPLPDNPEEEKQPEPIELSIESVDTETTRNIQNSAKTSTMPFWAWLAIIGGVVVVGGGVAVFILKRRK
jgi:hypothetical protein